MRHGNKLKWNMIPSLHENQGLLTGGTPSENAPKKRLRH